MRRHYSCDSPSDLDKDADAFDLKNEEIALRGELQLIPEIERAA